ncbi:MAG: hypothetical protein ACRD2G_06600, partial [Terriglobia bacterium]
MQLKIRVPQPLGKGCGVYELNEHNISLRWRKSTVTLTVNSDLLKVSRRMPVYLSQDLSAFRAALIQFDARGCMTHSEAAAASQRIAESVPLPSSLAYDLQHGNYRGEGYADLDSRFGLKVIAPLYSCAPAPHSGWGKAIGFETSYYNVVGSETQGFRLLYDSSERLLPPNSCGRLQSNANPAALTKKPSYLRLFFLRRVSRADHNNVLLSARSPKQLAQATHALDVQPYDCDRLRAGGVACLTVPKLMAFSAVLRVYFNSHPVYLDLGGTVGSALRSAGEVVPQNEIHHLKVWRPFNGRLIPVLFDRNTHDILGLVLVGGE